MSSSRRRLLRLFLTASVVLILAGYGAFTTFFFSPFEGDYEFDIATLVPRDVDFFAAKAGLSRDFDPFPIPAFADEFQASRNGLIIQRQSWYQELMVDLDVQGVVSSLAETLERAPIEVEPLDLFGGTDLALAGYFGEGDIADSRWAILGRTGWIGRFGVELLDRPSWIGLEGQGVTAEAVSATIQSKEQQVGVTLSGGQLTQPLTIGRINDVVVISTDPQLVIDAVRLGSVRGEDSFGQSAKFADQIDVERRDGDELELFVDAVKLSKTMGWTGAWPERGADTFLPAFLGRLFQMAFVNELAGRVDMAGGLTVDLEGQLSSELLGNLQKRLYRQRHFDKAKARRMASLAPADVGLFTYLHCDISDILGQVLDSLDEATISLLEDKVRDVWGYSGAGQLIEDFDTALEGKVAFFMRANDYEPTKADPPSAEGTVLVWALALIPEDKEKLAEIFDHVRQRPQAFGLQGLEANENGIYNNTLRRTGSKVVEYMNPLIQGTGQIVTLELLLSGGDSIFLISNSMKFLEQIDPIAINVEGAGANSLAVRPDFEVYVNTGLPSASVLTWVNPRSVGAALRTISDENVRLKARNGIDWDTITPGVIQRILQEKFGGVSEGNLTQNQREEFDILYDTATMEIQDRETAQSYPRLRQEAEDLIASWELINAGLFELALDPKSLAFHMRLAIPLDPPPGAN